MNASGFFRRLDIVRAWGRGILVLALLIIITSRPFSIAFLFACALLIPTSFLSLLRVPKPTKIAEFVSNSVWEFEQKIRGCHTTYPDSDIHTLHAFSPKLAKKARNIGNRMYFPECRTLVFCRREDRIELFVQTVSLYQQEKPLEESVRFDPLHPLEWRVEEADTDDGYHFVTICQGETTLWECYVPNTHAWRNTVSFCGDGIRITRIEEKKN